MKHFILFIILTFLINANSQIQGLQDYEHWLRKDSIDIGFKGFIYTDLNPYLKHYWYAERFDKEGFKKNRWDKLDRKEKDYWRGRVQQWSQDRVMPNMQYSPRPHHSS